MPDMVKVEKYGETNEGRELMLAYIAITGKLAKAGNHYERTTWLWQDFTNDGNAEQQQCQSCG